MEPEIGDLFVAFNDSLDEYRPKDPYLFNEILQVDILNSNARYECYVFNIRIESTKSIVNRINAPRFYGYSLICDRFDVDQITALVQEAIDGFSGSTWNEFIEYFSMFSVFEYVKLPQLLNS